jgi:hypothetical protein
LRVAGELLVAANAAKGGSKAAKAAKKAARKNRKARKSSVAGTSAGSKASEDKKSKGESVDAVGADSNAVDAAPPDDGFVIATLKAAEKDTVVRLKAAEKTEAKAKAVEAAAIAAATEAAKVRRDLQARLHGYIAAQNALRKPGTVPLNVEELRTFADVAAVSAGRKADDGAGAGSKTRKSGDGAGSKPRKSGAGDGFNLVRHQGKKPGRWVGFKFVNEKTGQPTSGEARTSGLPPPAGNAPRVSIEFTRTLADGTVDTVKCVVSWFNKQLHTTHLFQNNKWVPHDELDEYSVKLAGFTNHLVRYLATLEEHRKLFTGLKL